MWILLRNGKINPAFSLSPGPSSHHWKWKRWTVQRLSPPAMQEGRAHSMTPATKHKQLLSVTHFNREPALLEFLKLIFKKKKNLQPVSSDNHVNQTLLMFIPSSAPKTSAGIRTSPICTLQKVICYNCIQIMPNGGNKPQTPPSCSKMKY